ncbi:flagellar motor switch protein FliM [Yersinia mollaretii]|uniref:Flagellar motor switch protein FliM n=2 Tax=Yersinia mollaretii TaxID=33060 RepID=A0A0U1I853_YERMO|nr:flagellar motor switch protein FliM [Yersinia mollaretii]CNK62734.1 flagellar motor switch protein FliM [Yersinia enterocolitica]EEQ11010.1 Flagellar motor switch protein fliM [Yersinia mollaretii ATCC 43969]MDA5528403.1 flagellar motor switch protein FliM [Yersinia mollaretii]MDA5535599.1 flagellar motor switch protein FliM [Yersinia mollaretii]MDR7874370.1 flagellar motor switch protein FliM [Yersinia mollaretii]
MSDSILSQAEIDSLLNGGSNTESEDLANNPALDVGIKPYDPNTQRRVVRERLHSLEIINERFARQFRMGLFNLLRRSPDITAGNIKIQPYHEFARNLPVPTNLNLVHMNPLRGTALFVFSPNLVFMAVDNLFGGDGRFPTKADGREFTPTEQRVIKRMLTMALEAYDFAWSSIFKLHTEYVRAEIQVKFTNITSSPNDIVVTTPFYVEIGPHRGEFDICIPFSIIEPLRELLTSPPMENSRQEEKQWRNTLASQVRETELELVASFADIPTRLSQVMKMKEGDVIPIDKQESIEACVDGVPVFSGKYGCVNKQYALKVEKMMNPALLSLKKE